MKFNCSICNKEFNYRPRTKRPVAKFCSQECYGISRKGHAPWNKGKQTGIAPWKGKKRSQETIEKIRTTRINSGFRHSEESKEKIGAASRGKPRGGVSKLAVCVRGTQRYKKWRTDIFERDNYTCQECGIRGGKLNAHHKIQFACLMKEYQINSIDEAWDCEGLWDLDNGITLCLNCHIQTPNFANKKKNF